jgi:hypothetical protein
LDALKQPSTLVLPEPTGVWSPLASLGLACSGVVWDGLV